MSENIHPSAAISSGASIHPEARIGPYCVVGGDVKIGAGTRLMSHVVVSGHTTMGDDNRVFPFAVIGSDPQDLKYHGEPSRLEIGNENVFRENITISTGTEGGGMLTRIGNNCLMMAYAHVAHDCHLGNDIVMANCATLAGHVQIGDRAIIGGLTAIHQFTRIGQLTMLGGMTGVGKDVPPFCMIAGGYRAGLSGLNILGLRRSGMTAETISLLKQLYRILFQSHENLSLRLGQAKSVAGNDPACIEMCDFVRSAKKGVCMHQSNGGA